MSQLCFYFQPSFSGWMPTYIYEKLFIYYKSIYKDIIIKNNNILYNHNAGHKTGSHHLIIENTHTKKYKVVTYWDRPYELFDDQCGWDNNNCLGVYSAVNAKSHANNITPTSYCAYNIEIENYIDNINIDFNNKNNNKLYFRGYLYSSRFNLSNIVSDILTISNNRLSYKEYVNEINSYAIGISLDGAAEICNRDIEILGVGSVLLRPELITTNFHDPLIPDVHYASFQRSDDSNTQLEIIINKYKELINNPDHMINIAINGNKWYHKNGNSLGNISVLSNVLNIEELLL